MIAYENNVWTGEYHFEVCMILLRVSMKCTHMDLYVDRELCTLDEPSFGKRESFKND